MAGPFSALVFPYTDLPGQAWERLGRVFKPTYILQAAGMEPSPEFQEVLDQGLAQALKPGADRIGPEEIKPVLAEVGDWALHTRDPRDLAHLKGLLNTDSIESSPLALATAIRCQGREKEDNRLLSHVLLHLAAWREERQRESDQAVAGLKSQEQRLKQTLSSGLEGEDHSLYASLDPLAVKEMGEDPLLGPRLEAWIRLFSQTPQEADLWLTSPEVLAHLADLHEERTGNPPLRGKDLDSERMAEVLADSGLSALSEPAYEFVEPWFFQNSSLGQVLGLESTTPNQIFNRAALIGAIRT